MAHYDPKKIEETAAAYIVAQQEYLRCATVFTEAQTALNHAAIKVAETRTAAIIALTAGEKV